MIEQDPIALLVVARLFDFFHRRTPWHRRLWSIGTVLRIREVVEYSEGVHEHGLPDQGLKYAAGRAVETVDSDPGVGRSEMRDAVKVKVENLAGSPKPDRAKAATLREELRHLTRRAEAGYLRRWADHVRLGPPAVELSARCVASHLLDIGFSSDSQHRWLRALETDGVEHTLADILETADERSRRSLQHHDVLVPFEVLPGGQADRPEGWLDAPAAAAWIAKQTDGPVPRMMGAVLFGLDARDAWSAVEAAHTLVARLRARAAVGLPGTAVVRAVPEVFVAGHRKPFALDDSRRQRQVDVNAIQRQKALYKVSTSKSGARLDDALELLSAMEDGTPGASVTGGWAAVEGLLSRPSERDGTIAAERLADLVTCSFPRAELTTLAYRHADSASDDLARTIQAQSTNIEKARLVESALREGRTLKLTKRPDLAAQDRMEELISDRKAVFDRVRTYCCDTFRRLYNQRNLVMHSGTFNSEILRPTLRTAPALVGAGIDRIAHASLDSARPTDPLALAARARAELDLQGTPAQRDLVDLLE